MLFLSLILIFILLDWKSEQFEQLDTSTNLFCPGIQTSKSKVKEDEKPISPEQRLTFLYLKSKFLRIFSTHSHILSSSSSDFSGKVTDTSSNNPFSLRGFELEFTPGGRR